MVTNVCFKVLRNNEIVELIIPIEHNFEIISGDTFNGYKFPDVSIESQVIDYLDSIDKSEMMHKYNIDIIFDYYIKKEYSIDDEIIDFINYISKYISLNDNRQIRALLYEAKDILFGQNKSNETKIKELITLINISNKSIKGTFDFIERILLNNKNNLKYLE